MATLVSITVVSGSGLVVYYRDISPLSTPRRLSVASSPSALSFSNATSTASPSLFASLLSAIFSASQQTTNLPLTFMRLSNSLIACAIPNTNTHSTSTSMDSGLPSFASSTSTNSSHSKPTLFLCLVINFPPTKDNSVFHETFLKNYSLTLSSQLLSTFLTMFPSIDAQGIIFSKQFESFSNKIPETLRLSMKYILQQCMFILFIFLNSYFFFISFLFYFILFYFNSFQHIKLFTEI